MTKVKSKYPLTVLNISILIGIIILTIFTIIKWEELNRFEGWGIVGMVGLFGVMLFGLLLDAILRKLIKNKTVLNSIGAIITIVFLFSIFT